MSDCTKEYCRYLVAGERDRRWGLYVTGAGYQFQLPGCDEVPARPYPKSHYYTWQRGRTLDEYGLVYITQGKGEFESQATGHVEASVGDVLLLFPRVWHRYRPDKSVGWRHYWITFEGSDADRLATNHFIDPSKAVLKIGLQEWIQNTMTRILDSLRMEPAGFQQMIAADTLAIIAAAWGRRSRNMPTTNSRTSCAARKIALEEEADGLPVVEDLLGELSMSRTHFYRIFKKQVGLTPYQYHLKLQIQRARRMLGDSDMPVKQIARALHFQSAYHFSKLFKNKTGVWPSKYRNNKAAWQQSQDS